MGREEGGGTIDPGEDRASKGPSHGGGSRTSGRGDAAAVGGEARSFCGEEDCTQETRDEEGSGLS